MEGGPTLFLAPSLWGILANSSLAKGRPAGRLPLRCGRIARRHTRRDPGADTHGVRHLPWPYP